MRSKNVKIELMKKFFVWFFAVLVIAILLLCLRGYFIYRDVMKLKTTAQDISTLDNQNYETVFRQAEKVQSDIKPFKFFLYAIPAISKQSNLLDQIVSSKEIFREILGIGKEKTFLVLMQNNTELRPSGGFWGTYGILKIKNGEIQSFATYDAYDLDLLNLGKYQAPAEVSDIMGDQWRFWNSNWSPDFPTSVKQGLFFYQTVDPTIHFDGVIGPNVDYLLSLLAITGPINVPDHSFQINQNNFVEKLIYEPSDPAIIASEKANPNYVVSAEVKKPLLGELAELMLAQISQNGNYQKLTSVATTTFSALDHQDLLLYFSDDNLEKIVSDYGWAGNLQTSGNFTEIVDANLGSKLDFQVSKEANFKALGNGQFQVTLNYKNNFDPSANTQTQIFSTYRSLTRVFVPKSAKLISANGGQMESTMNYDSNTGSNFINSMFILKPQEEGKITLTWQVPEQIKNDSLKIYKQPGNHLKIGL